jgi:hypothetical protein
VAPPRPLRRRPRRAVRAASPLIPADAGSSAHNPLLPAAGAGITRGISPIQGLRPEVPST